MLGCVTRPERLVEQFRYLALLKVGLDGGHLPAGAVWLPDGWNRGRVLPDRPSHSAAGRGGAPWAQGAHQDCEGERRFCRSWRSGPTPAPRAPLHLTALTS